MAKAHYVSIDGVARNVTNDHFGVDGVARKVVSGYFGVDGIARQYFTSGIIWNKYDVTSGYGYVYSEVTTGLGGSDTIETTGRDDNDFSYSEEYYFTTKSGYASTVRKYNTHPSHIIGKYRVDPATVILVTEEPVVVENAEGTFDYTFTGTLVAKAKIGFGTVYEQGSTSYGTVIAPEGEMPEDGTFIEGSINEGYFVLQIDGSYYYYVMEV